MAHKKEGSGKKGGSLPQHIPVLDIYVSGGDLHWNIWDVYMGTYERGGGKGGGIDPGGGGALP